ncbi:CDP-glucose 4,6-dehydratase [Leptospira noguchii str. 1993005606]|uniref:CDP-glucose 4,6-dehydratase n=2 Tax=Leptospira noguchii TaxID=28182 RepID=M6YVZ7_9LEPT|nr:CDP-glucose 4,6-dehydratase [Leptospira noguchii]EMN01261.1 CDP-glucose 4,6-dehydratase [Leptospira noguchii str. 2007001578]EMO90528.1 CDP-glucose 4,6-dehydratase [Leptospira noguchii str. 2001034031]EPE83598.1 CDP-glucose 4,6-dehydratase [Leptospira noguchii str. 1993005606]
MDSLLKFFKNKRVLITGHTGFKGSWLAFILKEANAELLGFALKPKTNPNHFDLLKLKDSMQHVEGDVRNFDHMNQVMNDFKPEIVFHLAAQALVKESYDDPIVTFSTNILGSVNLLESVRNCSNVKSLVYVTSDKCYENTGWVWGYRETDPLGGYDPYSASKAAAELAYSSYFRSFFAKREGFGAASARAGNVIGGGDWSADRIIPDCVRAIQSGDKIILRSPDSTRPWQHVLEPLSGYLTLAKRLYEDPKKFSSAWNFGPSTQKVRTVFEVSQSIVNHMAKNRVEIEKTPSQIYEAHLLQLNCDKAHQLLNWYPRWDVDQTLYATAEWYKHYLDGKDMVEVTRAQAKEYFGRD